MSKILITADIHLGLADKLNDIIWSLKTISEYAKNNNIETIVILGDLFHDRVSLNIEVLNATISFFKSARKAGQSWIVFPGNHDMFMKNSWDINSVKILDGVASIISDIKRLTIDGSRFWVVPFVYYESVYMEIIQKLEQDYEQNDVLLTHIGVNNAILNECYLIKNWSTICFDYSLFDRVFAGHFHCHQNVGSRSNVWYPGSPIPYRYDEGMIPHGFLEYDLKTRDVKFIDIFKLKLVEGCPPDYLTVTDDTIDEFDSYGGNHVRIKLSRDYSADELTRLKASMVDRGAISTKFAKLKEETETLAKPSSVDGFKIADLFQNWLKHDKPKDLDLDLLNQLNSRILNNVKT